MKSLIRLQRVDAIRSSHVTQQQFVWTCIRSHSTLGFDKRQLHTTSTKEQPAVIGPRFPISTSPATVSRVSYSSTSSDAALSVLPLSQILRTWMITSVSSSPFLLSATSALLRRMLESRSLLFSLERNPLMRAILWHSFYKQFCAGETSAQVAQTCRSLREQGYAGVILEYALEVLKDAESHEEQDVATWKTGMLNTIEIAAPGDFIALKWSGMGSAAMRLMGKNEMPNERMAEAMKTVCEAAAAKSISLLPSAEETWTLEGYNTWSLYLQKIFNVDGKCVLYNTYQAYLKRTPGNLEKHLAAAKEGGYVLGVKVVRGAYLGSEERSNIWPTIEDTHHSYDSIASALLQKKNNDFVKTNAWPEVQVVLATHNADSVQKAQTLRKEQAARGEPLVPLAFAQLQGMADEVSCTLIAAAKASESDPSAIREKVFKCTSWGSMQECLNYLLRRAAENKDAAGRTHGTRDAMKTEIWRRMRTAFGLA